MLVIFFKAIENNFLIHNCTINILQYALSNFSYILYLSDIINNRQQF